MCRTTRSLPAIRRGSSGSWFIPKGSPAPGTTDVLAVYGRLTGMVPAAVLTWIPVVLLLDRGATMGQQRLLGIGTWLLLLALLWREDTKTRAQVGVVVVFATAVEYCFAGWLGVYTYRLHDVPWFVPPGHGLVYLGALAIGRSDVVRRHARVLVPATLILAAGYALWGLALSGRTDVLGAVWFGCLALFLLRGRRSTR